MSTMKAFVCPTEKWLWYINLSFFPPEPSYPGPSCNSAIWDHDFASLGFTRQGALGPICSWHENLQAVLENSASVKLDHQFWIWSNFSWTPQYFVPNYYCCCSRFLHSFIWYYQKDCFDDTSNHLLNCVMGYMCAWPIITSTCQWRSWAGGGDAVAPG